jgi:hypothetical protein
MAGELLLVFLYLYGFQIFGLENLKAVETLHVIDAVSSSNHFGMGVVTRSGLHNLLSMRFILTM